MATEVVFYIHRLAIFLLLVGFNVHSLSSVASGNSFFTLRVQMRTNVQFLKHRGVFSFLFLLLHHSNFQPSAMQKQRRVDNL